MACPFCGFKNNVRMTLKVVGGYLKCNKCRKWYQVKKRKQPTTTYKPTRIKFIRHDESLPVLVSQRRRGAIGSTRVMITGTRKKHNFVWGLIELEKVEE